MPMKYFRDASGTNWTVFEVRRLGARSNWPLLPHGYNDGWLCFESNNAKKRLIRYPEHWKEFTGAELEKLLDQAQSAPRSTIGLRDDLGEDSSTSPDARAD